MDPLPTNDQSVTSTPSSPERVDGISTAPTAAAAPPLDVVSVRQNESGPSGLMIVLIVVIIFGCIGLGGGAVVGGITVLGLFGLTVWSTTKSVEPSGDVQEMRSEPIGEMPTKPTMAPKQGNPEQPIAPPENPDRPRDKK